LNNRPRKRFGFLSPNEIFSLKLDLLHLSLESAPRNVGLVEKLVNRLHYKVTDDCIIIPQ
ncbi:MAG: hypothetical protein EAZ15_03195, partial [Sphingobacteriales bacterium]